MRSLPGNIFLLSPVLCLLLFPATPARAADIIRPTVLVVATYETGRNRGDVPGERQYWVERQKLDAPIPAPGLDRALVTGKSIKHWPQYQDKVP